jgi:uncharacterized coiled-coil protein SlyX
MTDAERITSLEADAHTMQEDIAWLQRKVEELTAQSDFVRGKLRLQHGRLLRLEGQTKETQPGDGQAG